MMAVLGLVVREAGPDPFHEGLRARMQGLNWSACPYPHGTYRRCDWLDGWDEEEALSSRMASAGRRR